MEYAYLVTLGAVIAVVVASAMYTRQVKRMQDGGVQAVAGAPEVEQATAVPMESTTPLPTIAPVEVHYTSIRPGGSTVWPVGGEVVRAYDAQNAVLWEALGSVRIHAALDIAGEVGESVLCAMDGVVKSAVRDELWGWRVRVEQTDGSEAAYAGLGSVDVTAGQSVTRSQQLGTLLESIPCEAELGPHLHMELCRAGKTCDPEGLFR